MIIKTVKKIRNYILFLFDEYHIYDFKPSKKYVIATFDRETHSGLADRLRHCLSLYIFCRNHNFDFKIYHKYPFPLEIMLSPVYDWSIKRQEMSKSVFLTKRINLWSLYKYLHCDKKEEENWQLSFLTNNLTKVNYQTHVFGNIHIYEDLWQEAFEELFRPSDSITNALKSLNLPNQYDAVTFRFQNLIGDFNEGDYETLDVTERDSLLADCRKELITYYNQGKFGCDKVLVTSDSITFLEFIKDIPFVITIPGSVVHPGFGKPQGRQVYEKSFVDLLALRGAQSITLFISGKMYESGFPEFAARIGNNNFSTHLF